jgi:ribosome assembly protein YihI (activator of Der GTPase)
MITRQMLESWKRAKNEAVLSIDMPLETVLAIQEMYIEAKQLRRDNLKLLDREDLLNALLAYAASSKTDHYLTPEMEEHLERITDLCDELGIDFDGDRND